MLQRLYLEENFWTCSTYVSRCDTVKELGSRTSGVRIQESEVRIQEKEVRVKPSGF
jgi:hypothetical protein